MKSDSTMKAIVLLIICTFFWGSCFPIGKHALDEVHALTLVFWRFVIAAACLGLYIKAARMPKPQLSFASVVVGDCGQCRWGWRVEPRVVYWSCVHQCDQRLIDHGAQPTDDVAHCLYCAAHPAFVCPVF